MKDAWVDVRSADLVSFRCIAETNCAKPKILKTRVKRSLDFPLLHKIRPRSVFDWLFVSRAGKRERELTFLDQLSNTLDIRWACRWPFPLA